MRTFSQVMDERKYSLEQRLIEPFRSIHSLHVSGTRIIISVLGFMAFVLAWWCEKDTVFAFWVSLLGQLISLIHEPWQMSLGRWPDFSKPVLSLPKLSAAIPPPTPFIWWSFAISSCVLYWFSGTWKAVMLPVRATTRFMIFLLWISLTCFALMPLQFQHSVDEWSKIYFLGAYGSFLIYAVIWICGVLWFPLPLRVKLGMTFVLFAYLIVGTPILIFVCTMLLHFTSLLMLPLFALAFAPLTQLGWFVAFYSIALSYGNDPRRELNSR